MNLTNTEIQSAIANLPDNVRKAVVTFDWANEILSIGNKQGLHMDNIEDFRQETLKVILGLSSSTNYLENLIKSVGVKKTVAESLVLDANNQIFHELQKRAFKIDKPSDTENYQKESHFDNYLEPIDHNDLRGPMAEEGVHLIDEHSTRPQTSLQNEIDSLSNQPYIDERSLDSFEMNSSQRQEEITDNNEHGAENTLVFKDEFNQEIKNEPTQVPKTGAYNEPIDESDLKGISGHRTDTSVLKNQHHINPDHAFNSNTRIKNSGRNLGQGSLNQSLDKHIMENPFIAKGDNLDFSPTEQEQIKEEGTFLQNLTNTEK